MTPKERQQFDEQPRPHGFTGLHRGQYWYKGFLWLGPTNAIGKGNPNRSPGLPKFRLIEDSNGRVGLYPTGRL